MSVSEQSRGTPNSSYGSSPFCILRLVFILYAGNVSNGGSRTRNGLGVAEGSPRTTAAFVTGMWCSVLILEWNHVLQSLVSLCSGYSLVHARYHVKKGQSKCEWRKVLPSPLCVSFFGTRRFRDLINLITNCLFVLVVEVVKHLKTCISALARWLLLVVSAKQKHSGFSVSRLSVLGLLKATHSFQRLILSFYS